MTSNEDIVAEANESQRKEKLWFYTKLPPEVAIRMISGTGASLSGSAWPNSAQGEGSFWPTAG